MRIAKKIILLVLSVSMCFGLSNFSFAVNQTTKIECNVKVNGGKAVCVKGATLDKEALKVVEETNKERASRGLSQLEIDEDLMNAAQVRSFETRVKWSHQRPDGSKWSSVCSKAFGENIAYGQSDSSAVVTSWMNSQGHKDNILRSSYTKIGVGSVEIDGVIFWTQLFG